MAQDMMAALQAAGFAGVEMQAGAIYARIDPNLPEFTVQPEAEAWRFSIQWPVRANAAQIANWNALHPQAPIDVDLGETRLQFRGGAQDLAVWADHARAMVAQCIRWRRETRARDEGM